MFVFNLTLKVDKEISLSLIKWIKEEYIPEVMATDLFTENKFFELIEPGDREASTFIMQYFTHSKENYHKYTHQHSPSITKKAFQKWGDKFFSFETFMQSVH